MTKVVINFKVDKDVKEEAQKLARDLGVPLSTIINAQIKQMLRSRTVTLTTDLKPTPYLEKILIQAEEDIKVGRNMSPVFDTADEMMAHLKNA